MANPARKKIGLLGGTYDPVHQGHLRIAADVCEQLLLDELHLIPCAEPVHKANPSISANQRLEMLKLAVADFEKAQGLVVDDRELRRQQASYSIDTVEDLRCEFGPEASIVMTMGTDAFTSFCQWHRWQEFLEICHIAVIMRPGAQLPVEGQEAQLLNIYGLSQSAGQQEQQEILASAPAGLIIPLTLTELDVSSTALREHIRSGQSTHFLLPDAVSDYIKEHGLYLNDTVCLDKNSP